MTVYRYKTEVVITEQDIRDVLGPFIDDRSSWAMLEEWPDTDDYGYKLPITIHEIEDTYGYTGGAADILSTHSLTYEMLGEGIVKAANYMGQNVNEFIDNCDAIGSDVAVQFALFGEARYG